MFLLQEVAFKLLEVTSLGRKKMVYFSLVHVSLISMVVPEHWGFFLVGGEGERIYPAWPTVDAMNPNLV